MATSTSTRIPWVIYTSPEIAWVGKTEQQLKAERPRVQGRHSSRSWRTAARVRSATPTGLVKFLADAKTDEILGVHMIGPMARELIAEAVVAMEFKAGVRRHRAASAMRTRRCRRR